MNVSEMIFVFLDKKIFQGDWGCSWCEIHWSYIHDLCLPSKRIRRNPLHRAGSKCCKFSFYFPVLELSPLYLVSCRYNFWWFVWTLQVHGAFAGYSGITVGICNTHYVYLPIPQVISYPRTVDPNSRMWHRCLTSTGQPDFI